MYEEISAMLACKPMCKICKPTKQLPTIPAYALMLMLVVNIDEAVCTETCFNCKEL
jgi:hypothetical protein